MLGETYAEQYNQWLHESVLISRVETLRALIPFHWPALVTVMQLSVTLVVTVVLDPLGHPL
jgi:hypothetical protein